MELRVTEDTVRPGAFYGSAIAALAGLVVGLMLHGPWERHPGGPHIWFSSAAAEELVRPAKADDDPSAVDDDQAQPPDQVADDQQVADLDLSYIPPDPLPVTRLAPERFPPEHFPNGPDAEPAAAGDTQRQDVDDLVADAQPQTPPADLD